MELDTHHLAPEGRRDRQTRAETANTQALFDKLDRLIAKNKPSKRDQIRHVFRDLYPRLEAHVAMGKPLKDVLAAFNELTQAKVCTRTFNEMFDEERARRDQQGNPVCCDACGHPLQRPATDQASVALSPAHDPIDSE